MYQLQLIRCGTIIAFALSWVNCMGCTFAEPRCDIVYNSACYDIHRDEVPWFTAVERCRQMNGSLAVFDDNIETYFASSLLFDDEPLWIGLRRSCCTWGNKTV